MVESALRFGFGGARRAITQFRCGATGASDSCASGRSRPRTPSSRSSRWRCCFLFLSLTITGKAMRAVADNPVLADSKGIDPDHMARLASAIGMGLAGIGGMLIGLDTSIDPLVGFRAILSVFAAAVVGGLGSIPGAVVGGFAIGLAEELSLLVLPATYKAAVGFLVILLSSTCGRRGCWGCAREAPMTQLSIAMATFGAIYAHPRAGAEPDVGHGRDGQSRLVGFYGLGAYISALLTVGLAYRSRSACLLRWPCTAPMLRAGHARLLRLRDDYLAIVTLGFRRDGAHRR